VNVDERDPEPVVLIERRDERVRDQGVCRVRRVDAVEGEEAAAVVQGGDVTLRVDRERLSARAQRLRSRDDRR
jgi:hypothetical protein